MDKSYNQHFLTDKKSEERNPIDYFLNEFEDYNIPMEEVLESLTKFTKNMASGPDNIPSPFVKHLPKTMKAALLDIFNKI